MNQNYVLIAIVEKNGLPVLESHTIKSRGYSGDAKAREIAVETLTASLSAEDAVNVNVFSESMTSERMCAYPVTIHLTASAYMESAIGQKVFCPIGVIKIVDGVIVEGKIMGDKSPRYICNGGWVDAPLQEMPEIGNWIFYPKWGEYVEIVEYKIPNYPITTKASIEIVFRTHTGAEKKGWFTMCSNGNTSLEIRR